MRLLLTILLSVLSLGLFGSVHAQNIQLSGDQHLSFSFENAMASLVPSKSSSLVRNSYLNAVSADGQSEAAIDPPTAGDDATSIDEDNKLVDFDILANDGGAFFALNKGSVDLDVATSDIQNIFTTTAGTFTVNNQGELSFIPTQDFNGLATIQYTVNNILTEISNVATVTITVNALNDAPVIASQNSTISLPENSNFTLSLTDYTITDVDGDVSFTLTILPGTNYTVAGNTVTPDANYNGPLTVNVTVSDGSADSPVFGTAVVITAVNYAPVIVSQNVTPIPAIEDTPFDLHASDFTITDADGDATTFVVLPGTNYTTSGNTITILANYNGSLTVNVKANDGTIDSDVFGAVVYVASVNDAPSISGGTINETEDVPFTLHASDFITFDADGDALTFTVLPGTNYTVVTNTVTPTSNYNGSLTVNVKVNDGTVDSPVFPATISIAPVNDAPTITGQALLATGDGVPLTLKTTDLTVADPDNTYPTGFTISILSGANYSVSNLTITPLSGFSGNLAVRVFVNDGTDNSPIYNLAIQVNYTNKPPEIKGQKTLTVDEDNPITLQVTDLTIADVDNAYPDDFSLTVQGGANYTFVGNKITPALNFNGTLSVKVIANDGSLNSPPYNVQITVNPVNDPPVINNQIPATISLAEDTPLMLTTSNLSISDPDNATFVLSVLSGTNYAVAGNTITPIQDYNGTLTVNVKVSDGSVDSAPFGIKITVTPVNDAPVIKAQTPNPIVATQNVAFTLQLSNFTIVDPDNTTFTLTVLPGTNYTFTGKTVTPALNFNGNLVVNVKVRDGLLDSDNFGVAVSVTPVNIAPVITAQKTLTVNEDESLTLQLTDLSVTDPDNSYPQDFTLVLPASGSNFTIVGNVITPAPNFFGMLSISTKVNDGLINSAAFNLKITVNAINDAPSFDAIADLNMTEDDADVTVKVNNISSGPLENQSMFFSATSSNPTLVPSVSQVIIGNSSQMLSIHLAPNQSGTAIITVSVTDIDSNPLTFSRTFTITVASVNDQPTLNALTTVSIQEDAPEQVISLAGITAGPLEGTQNLTLTALADNNTLVDKITTTYTSPQSTGSLNIKLRANAYGTSQITVTVKDDGAASPPPNVNSISRTFTLTVAPVNDLPTFTSIQLTQATIGELFSDSVKVEDIDNANITLTIPTKPAWLILTKSSNGKRAKLSGTPPEGSAGTFPVQLVAKDGGGSTPQDYQLTVSSRPVLNPFLINGTEDLPVSFSQQSFVNAFVDPSGKALSKIKITRLPSHGIIRLNGTPINANDEISVSSIGSLSYLSLKDYNGLDTLLWNGSNDLLYASASTFINFVIDPVNDAPVITQIETDSLQFPVGSEKLLLTPLFVIEDVDSDNLTRVEINFRKETYRSLYDRLLFTNTTNITGTFSTENGSLVLTGDAPVAEYNDAIRSVFYNYSNVDNPKLELKTVTFTATDGIAFSDPRDRYIDLIFTFEDLDIVTGFTPNGDGVNEGWDVLKDPSRNSELHDSKLKVYDKRGVIVFESVGFDDRWDGTYKGKLLPADSYFFTIEARDIKLKAYKKLYSGVVTIFHDKF